MTKISRTQSQIRQASRYYCCCCCFAALNFVCAQCTMFFISTHSIKRKKNIDRISSLFFLQTQHLSDNRKNNGLEINNIPSNIHNLLPEIRNCRLSSSFFRFQFIHVTITKNIPLILLITVNVQKLYYYISNFNHFKKFI